MTSAGSLGPRSVEFASPSISEADIEAVVAVMRSGWLTTGSECLGLEADLESSTGAPHAVAVSSCTAALEIALAWLRPRTGSVVAVPTWTFASTGLVAERVGVQPALVDIDPATLNMDPLRLEECLARHDVAAVIPVHIGGVPVSSEVRAVCAAAEVPIIEDAAHALGMSDDRGPLSGSDVVAACLSFYVTKNLTSAEGGAILTWDDELDSFARSYRLHGLDRDAWARYGPGGRPTYELLHPGIKANLPDLLASLARSQLRRFGEMQARRRELVNRYRALVAEMPNVAPVPRDLDPGSADHLFMVELGPAIERSAVESLLDEAGIRSSVHFRPLHTYSWFREHAVHPREGFPVADAMRDHVLSLPLHANLADADVDRVVEVLARAVG